MKLKENMTWNVISILTTIFSLLFLSYSLLVTKPSSGYEISIYSTTPKIFWVSITMALINGIFLIILSIFDKIKRAWLIGVFEVFLCNIIMISLHVLKGYVFYFGRGDAASYIGLAKDINIFGHFSSSNFYPVISILLSISTQLSSISSIGMSKLLPAFFFVIYFVGYYCWAKSISNKKGFVLPVLLASIPIFFAWFPVSIYHQMLSVWTLPFFFYCLYRNQDIRYRLICIIMCIVYPFWHPLTAVFVCFYLIVWFLIDRYSNNTNKNVSLSLILISLVGMLAWFINQYALLDSMSVVVSQLFGLSDRPSAATQAVYQASKLGFFSTIKTIYLMINDDLIYYVLSLISAYILVKQNNSFFRKKLFPIIASLISGSILLFIIFILTGTHNALRLVNLNINMIFTPLLIGYLLYYIFQIKQKVKYFLVLLLIGASVSTSIISLYPSPMTKYPNEQVTQSDITGTKWLISKKSNEIGTSNIITPITRFSDLIYGRRYRKSRADIRSCFAIPDHFGIEHECRFPIDKNIYLTITDFDIRSYTEVWKDIDRYTKEDFYKLNLCDNADKIYENGELRNFLIYE
jgi:hypothetical protein